MKFLTNITQNVQISIIFFLKTHFIFKDYRVSLKKQPKTLQNEIFLTNQ